MPLSTHEHKPVNDVPFCKDYSSDEDDIVSVSNLKSGLHQFFFPCHPMQLLPTQPQEVFLKDTFSSHRPPHAFPTVYTSGYEYGSLQIKNFKFPSPIWPRKCSTTRCTKAPVDMDQFIRDFGQKLHLRGPLCNNRHSGSTRSWCATRTVVPCPAPLPALVQLSALSQSLPARSTKLTIPRIGILSSQPVSVVAPAPKRATRLPKCSPQFSFITSHSQEFFAEKQLFNYPVPTCQSPFFGSNSSSRRSSYSSSGSSSGPTTPLQSTASLPQDIVNKASAFSPDSQFVEDHS